MKHFDLPIFAADRKLRDVLATAIEPFVVERREAHAKTMEGRVASVVAALKAKGIEVAGHSETACSMAVVGELRRRLREELSHPQYGHASFCEHNDSRDAAGLCTKKKCLDKKGFGKSLEEIADLVLRIKPKLFHGIPYAPNHVTAEDVAEAMAHGSD